MKKEREIPSARATVPGLSEQVDNAIRKSLHPDAKERPRSCLEFFKLLTTHTKFDDGNDNELPSSVSIQITKNERVRGFGTNWMSARAA